MISRLRKTPETRLARTRDVLVGDGDTVHALTDQANGRQYGIFSRQLHCSERARTGTPRIGDYDGSNRKDSAALSAAKPCRDQ